MKLFIGILILLFALTTMGFSGVAYADQCESVFTPDIYNEYGNYSYYDSRAESEGFPYFIENRERSQHYEDGWTEFDNTLDSHRESDYSDLF